MNVRKEGMLLTRGCYPSGNRTTSDRAEATGPTASSTGRDQDEVSCRNRQRKHLTPAMKIAYSRDPSSRCYSSELCGDGVAATMIATKRQKKVEMRMAENIVPVFVRS